MTEAVVLVAFLITLGVSYEVLYSLNCGSEMEIKTPLLTFNSDEMYEGLNSKSLKKDSLPPKYNEVSDIQLLSYQRTTDNNAFSYFLRLGGADHYLLLMKFIEVAHDKPKDRVFQVWLGQEQLFSIDIVSEAGVGEVLHKFVQFELVDDVLYINKTTPVLNGYIYPKQMMQLTFVKVSGQPKVQALVLLKGSDSEKFVREYLQTERVKANRKEQTVAQKYQKPSSFAYRHLQPNQWLSVPELTLSFYLNNMLSIDTFFTLVAVAFVFFHEKIYQKLNIPKQEIKDQ